MDFEVADFLQRVLVAPAEQAEEPSVLQHCFTYLNRRHPSLATESETDRQTMSLLWTFSHFMSAIATGRNLLLGYVEQFASPFIASRTAILDADFPTSIVLKNLHYSDSSVNYYICGGRLSAFEEELLTVLHQKTKELDRLGVIVVRHAALDAQFDQWVNQLVADQSLISHVLVMAPSDLPSLQLPILATGWSKVSMESGASQLTLFSNQNWNDQVDTVLEKQVNPDPVVEEIKQQKLIPFIDMARFGGIRQVDVFPSESLAGAELSIFDIVDDGTVQLRSGRLHNSFDAPEEILYECLNANISHSSTVWRDNQALLPQFFYDKYKLTPDNRILVSEPSRMLAGTYFLAPTGQRNHSHFMVETLRRLYCVNQPHIKILALSSLESSQREYFEVFGLTPDRIVYRAPEETCQVERLIVSLSNPWRYGRRSLSYLKNIGLAHYERSERLPSKVYFSRRDSRPNRNLINADEVEAIFEAFGFSIIQASHLSAQEKVAMLSQAEYVAGPLGAAFEYLPFSQSATAIMLTTSFYFPPSFSDVASMQLKRLNVIQGVGLKLYSRPWQYAHSSFYIPARVMESILRTIIKT